MKTYKRIVVTENTQAAIKAIRNTRKKIKVEFCLLSGIHGAAQDLLALAAAMRAHPNTAIAEVSGISSVIPLTGADSVSIVGKGLAFIGPLSVTVYGNEKAQREADAALRKITKEVSNALARWPAIQGMFNSNKEVFLTAADFRNASLPKKKIGEALEAIAKI